MAQCMRVDLFGCRDCKCSIFCYIRLVIMFKDYCFIRKTFNNYLFQSGNNYKVYM